MGIWHESQADAWEAHLREGKELLPWQGLQLGWVHLARLAAASHPLPQPSGLCGHLFTSSVLVEWQIDAVNNLACAWGRCARLMQHVCNPQSWTCNLQDCLVHILLAGDTSGEAMFQARSHTAFGQKVPSFPAAM